MEGRMTDHEERESKLNKDFSAKLILKLIDLIGSNLCGKLDGQPLESVSIKASGRRFVIKGWVDKKAGPAIRFSAPWGDLGNGYALFQASVDAGWEDAEETAVDLDFGWEQAVLAISFNLEDGSSHEAAFTGRPQ